MITEAIILAGGKGTRLKSVIDSIPKPMAPVNDLPFLNYMLEELSSQGVKKVLLAVGYKHEKITSYYGNWFKDIEIDYVIENRPLGTGGAIKKALTKTKSNNPVIINGDTLFKVDFNELYQLHLTCSSHITLALKHQDKADRYGTVNVNSNQQVTFFNEKKENSTGWINGGIYLLDKKEFDFNRYPEVFSFEKEVLEKTFKNNSIYGYKSDGYFIDIGIPSDYKKAQEHLKNNNNKEFPKTSSDWTLFLDRDGVINHKRENDYVKSIEEFRFIPGVIVAISKLNKYFGNTFIVTNQQCVGKGIISSDTLSNIHDYMLSKIKEKSGRITDIYFAPNLVSENSFMRKPKTGMAEKAKKDYPSINFSKAIMVGDSMSDMEFGKRKGMITVGIKLPHNNLIDFNINHLSELLKLITN